MDETKTTTTNTETVENNSAATEIGVAEGKTFSQEDVNRIVSERLTREKQRLESAFTEREQGLAKRELLLTAREKMIDAGLPVELLDALNMVDAQTLDNSINLIKAAIAERPSSRTTQMQMSIPMCGSSDDKMNVAVRNAMGLNRSEKGI